VTDSRDAAARALHENGLDAEFSLLPFAEAVVRQLSDAPGSERETEETAGKIARVLRSATSADTRAAVDTLLSDPPLLAAFFQNADLLDTSGPRGSAIADMVMGALAKVWETPHGR
jgi:hypothetical protein